MGPQGFTLRIGLKTRRNDVVLQIWKEIFGLVHNLNDLKRKQWFWEIHSSSWVQFLSPPGSFLNPKRGFSDSTNSSSWTLV